MKSTMKSTVLVAMIAALSSGCVSYSTGRYAINADNVVALRTLNNAVNVGVFTATAAGGQSELSCRGGVPIRTADGEPFSEFVRKAFLDELRIANAFSASAPVTLTGNLDSIDFWSTGDGVWNLVLTLKASNGKSMNVLGSYAYRTSWDTGCSDTAQAFVPAVQNLLGKVVRSKNFSEFVTP